MPNKKMQIEELFSLAKEASLYGSLENELLRSVAVAQVTRESRRKKQSTQATSKDASFQDKLQLSYGL
ncbi:MAG: hypothetical protein K8H84_00670 [Sulfuricella denitrificans]|nr:hypothetical protein [Sulfuricella denitrificans]